MKPTFAPSASRRTATLRAVLVGLATLAVTASAPLAAAVAVTPGDRFAVSAPPPGLSITLSDATALTQSGATLVYTAAVTNAGANPVAGTLEITIPSYAAYVGAAAGNEKGADLRWPITIGAGKSVSRKVTVRLGNIPKGEVRFTTIATVYPAGNTTQILVRTADPDAIRGVVDPAHSVGSQPPHRDHSNQVVLLIAITAGAIVVAALVFLVLIRKRYGERLRGIRRSPTNRAAEGDHE